MSSKGIFERRREIFRDIVTPFANQELAANALGLSGAAQVSHLKTGRKNIGEELARRIESKAGLPAGAMVSPENASTIETGLAASGPRNIYTDGDMTKIPIIDLVQAGAPELYTDPYEPGDADRYITDISPVSEGTFALRVDGHSMTQDREPSYPHDSIIVCEPTLAGDVRIGDDVVAKILKSDERVFKSYDKLDGRHVLVPRNKQFPVIRDEFEILAIVVQMIVKRR